MNDTKQEILEWNDGTTAASEGTIALLLLQYCEEYCEDGVMPNVVNHFLPAKETCIGCSLGDGDWQILFFHKKTWGNEGDISRDDETMRVIKWMALPDEADNKGFEELTVDAAKKQLVKRHIQYKDDEKLNIIIPS